MTVSTRTRGKAGAPTPAVISASRTGPERRLPRRWADIGRGFGALVGVLVLVVGVPAALISWVGWPLPAALPTMAQLTSALRDTYIPDEFLIKALAIVCWLVWVELVASLIVETVAMVRGRHAGRVPMAGGVQRAAARLVATVALLGALVSTRGLPELATQTLRPLARGIGHGVTLVVDGSDVPGDDQPERVAPAPAPVANPVYEVQRRDTLWDISEKHLGDPFRWGEIFEMNRERVQPDGRSLSDPDRIYPGWQLQLPVDAIGVSPSFPLQPIAPPNPAPPGPAEPPPSSPLTVDPGLLLVDDSGGRPAGAVPRDGSSLTLQPDDPEQ